MSGVRRRLRATTYDAILDAQGLLKSALADVQLTYQNLESVELGVTTVDNYFDTLGGITRAVRQAKGGDEHTPVYIGDQTRGDGTVRSLSEQVALETRTRMLNPKWYEGMLKHGYEGVRQIESHLTNTMGWSATTSQVEPWVYQRLTQTYLLDAEMRERLEQLIGERAKKLWLGTFHSICIRILRMDIEAIGFRRDFAIWDDDAQARVPREDAIVAAGCRASSMKART